MNTMMMRAGALAAALLATLAAAPAQDAAAQQQQQPKPSVSKDIEGWTLRCFDNKDVQRCKITEVLVNKKTGRQVLGVSLQYFPDQKRSLVEIGVPLGMALENGASVVTDTYKTGTLRYTICYPQGCYVATAVDEGAVEQLGRATKASVDVVQYGSGKKLSIPFPMDGFSAAYRAMVENSHGAPAAAPAAPAN